MIRGVRNALTVAVTVDLPMMEIVAQLSDVQRRALFEGLARALDVVPAAVVTAHTVKCADCPALIEVPRGRRPKRLCSECAARRNRDLVRAHYYRSRGLPVPSNRQPRAARAAPSLPGADAMDLRKIGPEPPPVVDRRTEVERRIGAMMALDQGDPRAQSTLLKRFDERRTPRR